MFALSNILVPVVFSRRCAWAARHAASIAAATRAHVVFLNVNEEGATERLKNFVSREVQTISHRCVVVDGDPAERIVELARDYEADLIVMPTYNARFRAFLLGSVTAKVLHDADCPVMTGVHRYDDSPEIPPAYNEVLCALDNASGCVPVLRWAQGIAAKLGAHLDVVHALPAVDEVSENCGEREVRRYLMAKTARDFATRLAEEPQAVEVELRGGPVDQVVREAALSKRANLVVIGRGHADRLLGRLRTQTYAIIRDSPCPVISV
ncbi:MAG: universal stress protein [Bryobacteraceae bacterium]